MKTALFICITAILTHTVCAQSTLFQQDFSAGGVPGNYVSGSPNNMQFDGISGATVTNGTLQLAKPISVTNTAHFARNTDLSPVATSVYIQMDVEIVTASTVAAENALTFYVGENFTSSVAGAVNPSVHSRFGINLLTNGSDFGVRHVEPILARSKNSQTFSGKQTITFVVNNSGYIVTYLQPGGGIDTVANDRYDLWVGTTHVFDGFLSLTPTNDLSDFKLRYDDRGNATVQFDNFLIRDINGALPLSVADFRAVSAGSHVDLSWQAANPSASLFALERSPDAQDFAAVGQVRARAEQTQYTFTDEAPVTGTNYYRLRQTNTDGSVTVSKIVAADASANVPSFTVLDNPGVGSAISVQTKNLTRAIFQLATLTGQQIGCQQQKTPDGQVTLLLQHPLPSGVYLLTAVEGTNRLTRRVLLH